MGRKELLAVIATGLCLVAAFPPFRTGFLALGALVPLLYVLEYGTYRNAFLKGYIAGLIFSSGTLYWIMLPSVAGGILLIFALPVFMGFLSILYRFFRIIFGREALWLFPFLWTAFEWVLMLGQMAFPWNILAYSQSYYLPLIQFAEITGIAGVTFWVVLCNIFVFRIVEMFRLHRRKEMLVYIIIMGLCIIAPFSYGQIRMAQSSPQQSVRILMVQGNIDPYEKWASAFVKKSFGIYLSLTRESSISKPDLIIWPETAAPTYLANRQGRGYAHQLHHLVDSLTIPVLTGAPFYQYEREHKRMHYFNSVFLFSPGDDHIVSYDKIKLVPFSEKIPFEEEISILRKINLGEADFSFGTRATVFNVESFKFGTVICFESAFPHLVRNLVRKGAGIIVNITNDAWFGKTSGPYQHLRIAVFRAIENRVSIARCANSGISAFIDPYGRILSASPLFTQTTLSGDIVLQPAYTTFFTRHGDLVSPLCTGIVLCAIALGSIVGLRIRRVA